MIQKIRLCLFAALLLCLAVLTACAKDVPPAPADPIPPAVSSAEAETSAPPHTHRWGEWTVLTPPDCTKPGKKARYCPCGQAERESVPMTEHTPGEWAVIRTPSCTAEGERQKKCAVCEKVLATAAIPPAEHIPGEWAVIRTPSCTAEGEQQQSCTVCEGILATAAIPMTRHTPGEWEEIHAPTCTAEGEYQKKCTVCRTFLSLSTKPKTDHTPGEWVEIRTSSCGGAGVKQQYCTVCGTVVNTSPIPTDAHTPGEWVTAQAPTALRDGTKQQYCTVCGALVGSDTIPSYAQSEAERVSAVLNGIQNDTTLSFAALAYMHIASNSNWSQSKHTQLSSRMASQSVSYISKAARIDAAVLLGDYTASTGAYTIADIKADFALAKEYFSHMGTFPTAWLRGNHEINYSAERERTTTDEELYEYIDKNSTGLIRDPDNPYRGYGYMDFPAQKIRIICLNTSDALEENPATPGTTAAATGISTVQLRWLAHTALDFSDKDDPGAWAIVVCSHHALNYTPLTRNALQILEAYRDREAGTVSYSLRGVQYAVSYNFTGVSPAEILCNIHGHNHNFVYEKIGTESPWLWRLCTPCINSGRENECATYDNPKLSQEWGEFDENGDPVYYRKAYWSDEIRDHVYDDAHGTSYCIITIDRKSKTIYAHYVGVGRDRVICYTDET